MCISNVSDILQLVEQELLTLPKHHHRFCCVVCVAYSSVFSVMFVVHCLVCFFVSFPFQYCLSFDLWLTFELLNAYNFETCFVTLYNCTFRRVLCDSCFSGVLCDFETSCPSPLSCGVWTAMPCSSIFEIFNFLVCVHRFWGILKRLCSSSILWKLETSCVPLIFYGI